MKFVTLTGTKITKAINPSRFPRKNRSQSPSRGHHHLGQVLDVIFPDADILEEFDIPETRLRIDFYIPRYQLAFEFDGAQHHKFNLHFHGSQKGFAKQLERDTKKQNWCEINNIRLIRISDEKITADDLRKLINEN